MTSKNRTNVLLVGPLEALVRERIASVAADWADDPCATGRLAQAFQLIPLLGDGAGVIGMDANGRFTLVSWGNPPRATPVLSAELQDHALLSGLRFYPELAPLLPERPVDARVCKGCGGTGDLGLGDTFVCSCGGLGWIPDYWAPWRAE